jgi:hypothetical protein
MLMVRTVALEFFFERAPVGYFLETEAYPSKPGTYRFMPYRGVGLYKLGQKCGPSGVERCSYPGPDGPQYFTGRPGATRGTFVIEEIES